MKRFRSNPFVFLIAAGLWAIPPMAHSQGCIPAHFMSLTGLGPRGIDYLAAGEFQAAVSHRFLYSNDVFIGNKEQPKLHHVGTRNSINSIDLSLNYAISSRFNLGLALPFEHDSYSSIQGDLMRHHGSTGGVGDLRLVANGWVLDPAEHPEGNVLLGLGVKFPTGDDNVKGEFHTSKIDADGNQIVLTRPIFLSAQLGDGGYGILLQLQAFQKVVENVYGYVAGDYLINPQNETDTKVFPPNINVLNTIPDSYSARAGLSYVIWPAHGVSLSFGSRIDGVPVHDLVGGSRGFRIAGYSVYVDPGVSWSFGKSSVGVNIPVAVERNIQETSTVKAGALASYLVVTSYSLRF